MMGFFKEGDKEKKSTKDPETESKSSLIKKPSSYQKKDAKELENRYNRAVVDGLSADIERLKAQSEANNELRQMFSEKFSRIDEQVGELRSMLVERERDMQSLEVTATKASDLVAEVQPEKLLLEVRRQDARIEALKGKLETHEQVNDTLMEELRQLRETVRTFRGVKEIEKMNRELLDDQTAMRKIEAKIEGDSDKVESMFLEMNRKYEEYRHFKDEINTLTDGFKNIERDFSDFKIKFSSLTTKEEFDKFKKELLTATDPVISEAKDFEKIKNTYESVLNKIEILRTEFKTLSEKRDSEFRNLDKFKRILQDKFDERIKNYESIVLRLQKQVDMVIHENENELDKAMQRMESLDHENQELEETLMKSINLTKKLLDRVKEMR